LSVIKRRTGQINETEKLLLEIHTIAKKLGYLQGLLSNLINQSSIYFIASKTKLSFEKLVEAKNIALVLNDQRSLGIVLANTGNIHNQEANFNKAIERSIAISVVFRLNNLLEHLHCFFYFASLF